MEHQMHFKVYRIRYEMGEPSFQFLSDLDTSPADSNAGLLPQLQAYADSVNTQIDDPQLAFWSTAAPDGLHGVMRAIEVFADNGRTVQMLVSGPVDAIQTRVAGR